MSKHITASPLTWPEGWGRTKDGDQLRSRFGEWNKPVSIAKATGFILQELSRMGIPDWNVIVSTDLRLRQDGLPYSAQREPEDKGAAVWWRDGDDRRVIALDKYDRIADNLWAIGKTIEAMRGIERWGGGEILNRTFTGFTALPGPDQGPTWRDVLDYYGDDINGAREAFKIARLGAHPDKGGSTDKFHAVKEAWAKAQDELGE